MRAPLLIALAFAASSAACATAGDATSDPDAAPAVPEGDASGGDAGSGARDAGHDAGTVFADAGDDSAAAVDAGLDAPPACVEMDAGCTTPNPGACFPGTLQCDDGGMQLCVPNVTAQPCYSGPAGTENVGVCKGGTQSCLGALGACNGQVVPATAENCFNGLDNDCNGTVGNGCPQSLSLGGDRTLGGAGGPGGGAAALHCPVGAFVTRVDSWFDNADEHASGVSIYCATPTLVQGATTYSITLTPNAPAPYQTITGANSPTMQRSDDCGISGLTAITYTDGIADTYVQGLGSHCGTSAVTLQANDNISFDFTTNGDTSYNTWSGAPGAFFDEACNPNEVVVGFLLHYGSWMDNIAPICAALQVNYKP